MDALELLGDLGPLAARIDGMVPRQPDPQPIIRLTCATQHLPPALRAQLALLGKPAEVPGADAAIVFPDASGGAAPRSPSSASRWPFAVNGLPTRFPPPAEPAADLVVEVALAKLCAAEAAVATGERAKELTAIAKALEGFGKVHYEASLVPEGIKEKAILPHVVGLKPVDRSVLEPLPASTLITLAVGLDGPGLWEADHDRVLAAIAERLSTPDKKVAPAEVQSQADALLGFLGVPLSLGQVIQGFDGTLVIAIGQGLPVPSVTVALPRTMVTDQLMRLALEKMHVPPPEEGASALVPIPNVPASFNLVKGSGHWVLTSDASVMTGWTGHERGGWSDSPAGRLALEKAPPSAVAIGSSDTPTVLRLASGLVGLFGQGQMSPSQQQLATEIMSRLAGVAKTGYLAVTDDREHGLVVLDRSLFGMGLLPASLLGSLGRQGPGAVRHPGEGGGVDEAAAQLRDVIMPAEAAFKAKKIIDRNHDGQGEYGLLSELGGARPILGSPAQRFVPADLASGSLDGWHYEVFIPDGHGGGMGEPEGQAARTVDGGAAQSQERHWVAYAWPDDPAKGNRILALLPDGVVRSAPYTPGDVPEWSDVFGGGNSWEAKPAWQPQSQSQPSGAPAP